MSYYFAIFIPACEGGYVVMFPDFPEAVTQGDTLSESMEMGADILNIAAEEYARTRKALPVPSGLEAVQARWKRELTEEPSGIDTTRPALFQLFAAPKVDMTPVKISVSVARSILDNMDRKARTLGLTRSGLLARAAEAYSGKD
jgi:predicted RNase H-like HicB family nuclease